ncbi:MAG: tetratricopeptide repeat protein [Chthoniobacterales bacterium]
MTFAVYAQVAGHQFISFDDNEYITANPIVARGLTGAGLLWAFTTFHAGNWHPLTWLAHMFDSQLFGLWAGGHLLVNVAVHTASVLLLFWFLRRATGAKWPSACVASLFALHPLHVESVAWAAERKDTLAAFFGLLTLLAYLRYTERASPGRYVLVGALFALGLMAKPMLVTWPFVMLLLDYWPLRRLTTLAAVGPRLREKVPLFALSAAAIVATLVAQTHGYAIRALSEASIGLRLANAIVSYAKYILAIFWPNDLAVYYPFPVDGLPAWQVWGAFVLLAVFTAGAVWNTRSRPYLLVGWLWFVGTLVPVIGLVQVGGQAMADRYAYLPSIGLFLALVFGLAELAVRWRPGRGIVGAAAAFVLVGCAAATAKQVGYWRDSETLFQHALAVTKENFVMEYNLGCALGQQGRYAEAIEHFDVFLRADPKFSEALLNKGIALAGLGRHAEALPYLERAAHAEPDSILAHSQLALTAAALDRGEEALAAFRRVCELDPESSNAHANLGLMLSRLDRTTEAEAELDRALQLDPRNPEAQNGLGRLFLTTGRTRESVPHFQAALDAKPDFPSARQSLEYAERQLGENQ